MTEVVEKAKWKYEPGIIASNRTIANPVDVSTVPVYTLENCEVLFSSLTAQTPKFGHSIKFMLPQGSNFPAIDRQLRNDYLTSLQQNDETGEFINVETIKGTVSLVSKKDVLDNLFTEDKIGRAYMTINVSNAVYLDETVGADGKTSYKGVKSIKEVTGTPIVKYFRATDAWTGDGIEPEVFKYENGNKVKTFINPNTQVETNLYVGTGDLVNIKLRPYSKVNGLTHEITWRYNILSIEIVQTAYDRGIRTSGGGKVIDKPDAINSNILGSIFAGANMNVATTTTTPPVPQAIQQAQQTVPVPQPVIQATTTPTPVQTVAPQPAPVQQQATNEVPTIDFSALANLDMSNLNLGE